MKIKNFNELDRILKNSFKQVRDEAKKGDDKLSKQLVSFDKEIKNSSKKYEESKKEVLNSLKNSEGKFKELKKEFEGFRKLQKKTISEAENKIDSKISSVNSLVNKFKKDVINVIRLIKTKTVSQEVFEKRMRSTDENTKKIGVYLKEIIVLRDSLKESLGNVGLNKNEINKVNSRLDSLSSSLNKQITELLPVKREVKEIEKKAVDSEEFNKEIKEIKNRLDNEVKEAVSKLKEVNKIRGLEESVNEIKRKGVSESELKELKRDEIMAIKDLKSEIKLIKREVATKASLNNEIERLRGQLKDLKQVMGDWNKRISEELKTKKESTKFMSQINTILEDKKKETDKISEREEIRLDFKEVEEKQKNGTLKKAVSGIVDFFVEEEEDEIKEEEIKEISRKQKKDKIRIEREKREEIEKIEMEREKERKKAEKESKKRKPKIEIIDNEEKEEKGEGTLTKVKDGIVSFFFEEVEDDEEEKEGDIERFKKLEEKKGKPSKIEVYGKDHKEDYKEKDKEDKKSKKRKSGPKREIGGGKKKYKKLDKDTFVDDFGKEKTYYPEDYFY